MSDIEEAEPRAPGQEVGELPVIRKGKGGRPRRKPAVFREVQPAVPDDRDEAIEKLKQEIEELKAKARTQKHAERAAAAPVVIPPPQQESPAFKGRPLPYPLPEGFPEINPLEGDKTPSVVEWFRDNDPEEFEVRYRNRRTHLRPGVHKDEDEDAGKKQMGRGSDPTLNTTARSYGG